MLAADLHLDPNTNLLEQLSCPAAAADPARLQLLGVALLQLFVQANWTGSPAKSFNALLLPSLDHTAFEEVLVGDSGGDSLVPVAEDPALLAAAKIILVDKRPDSVNPLLSVLWSLRCCLTLQDVLEEESDQLHATMSILTAAGRAAVVDDSCEEQQLMAGLFHLEAARFHSVYHEVREMVRATEEAGWCVGLTVKDTGALGRRTKYQVP